MKQGKLGAAVLGNHATKEVGIDLSPSFEIMDGTSCFNDFFSFFFVVQAPAVFEPTETSDCCQDSRGLYFYGW